jgi:hypothetical protein
MSLTQEDSARSESKPTSKLPTDVRGFLEGKISIHSDSAPLSDRSGRG